MTQRTTRWPMDFGSLARGDVLKSSELEDVVRVWPSKVNGGFSAWKKAQREYELRILNLRQQIEDHFHTNNGDTVRVVQINGNICILSPDEQDEWCQQKYRQFARNFAKVIVYDAGNDTALLSDDRIVRRDRRILVNTWRAQQLTKRPDPKLTNKDDD